eukprot:jgi/Botrbrau1/20912/Bobra.0135s0043.1
MASLHLISIIAVAGDIYCNTDPWQLGSPIWGVDGLFDCLGINKWVLHGIRSISAWQHIWLSNSVCEEKQCDGYCLKLGHWTRRFCVGYHCPKDGVLRCTELQSWPATVHF